MGGMGMIDGGMSGGGMPGGAMMMPAQSSCCQ
jgi:hypothetical protein